MSIPTLLFFVSTFAFCVAMAKLRSNADKDALQKRINILEAELLSSKMKNASYRGKIGSLSRKLKEANA